MSVSASLQTSPPSSHLSVGNANTTLSFFDVGRDVISRVFTSRHPYTTCGLGTITTCFFCRPGDVLQTFCMTSRTTRNFFMVVSFQGIKRTQREASHSRHVVSGSVHHGACPDGWHSPKWRGAYVQKWYIMYLSHSLWWFLLGSWTKFEGHVRASWVCR